MIDNKTRVIAERPEWARKVLIRAQIDLTACIEYALGLGEYPNLNAAQRTLQEIYEITGDPVGKGLMYRELDIG